jgi:hypothetical protein
MLRRETVDIEGFLCEVRDDFPMFLLANFLPKLFRKMQNIVEIS